MTSKRLAIGCVLACVLGSVRALGGPDETAGRALSAIQGRSRGLAFLLARLIPARGVALRDVRALRRIAAWATHAPIRNLGQFLSHFDSAAQIARRRLIAVERERRLVVDGRDSDWQGIEPLIAPQERRIRPGVRASDRGASIRTLRGFAGEKFLNLAIETRSILAPGLHRVLVEIATVGSDPTRRYAVWFDRSSRLRRLAWTLRGASETQAAAAAISAGRGLTGKADQRAPGGRTFLEVRIPLEGLGATKDHVMVWVKTWYYMNKWNQRPIDTTLRPVAVGLKGANPAAPLLELARRGDLFFHENAPVSLDRPALSLPLSGKFLIGRTGSRTWMRYIGVNPDDQRLVERIGGSGADPSSYLSFGKPVLAPLSGRVAYVNHANRDRHTRILPARLSPRMSNCVIIESGVGNRYVVVGPIAHRSARVRAGQLVSRGETIARVGNIDRPGLSVLVFAGHPFSGGKPVPVEFANVVRFDSLLGSDRIPELRFDPERFTGHLVANWTEDWLLRAREVPQRVPPLSDQDLAGFSATGGPRREGPRPGDAAPGGGRYITPDMARRVQVWADPVEGKGLRFVVKGKKFTNIVLAREPTFTRIVQVPEVGPPTVYDIPRDPAKPPVSTELPPATRSRFPKPPLRSSCKWTCRGPVQNATKCSCPDFTSHKKANCPGACDTSHACKNDCGFCTKPDETKKEVEAKHGPGSFWDANLRALKGCSCTQCPCDKKGGGGCEDNFFCFYYCDRRVFAMVRVPCGEEPKPPPPCEEDAPKVPDSGDRTARTTDPAKTETTTEKTTTVTVARDTAVALPVETGTFPVERADGSVARLNVKNISYLEPSHRLDQSTGKKVQGIQRTDIAVVAAGNSKENLQAFTGIRSPVGIQDIPKITPGKDRASLAASGFSVVGITETFVPVGGAVAAARSGAIHGHGGVGGRETVFQAFEAFTASPTQLAQMGALADGHAGTLAERAAAFAAIR